VIELCLAIETSCDDTSVALVAGDGEVRGLISANQDLAHEPFGGIVPEIACRNHSVHLLPLIQDLFQKAQVDWSEVHGIAVTNRPGLVGSLIVGVVTAKTLAQTKSLPMIGVNHLEGHVVAPFLRDAQYQPSFDLSVPMVGLAVSGGHTSLYRIQGFSSYQILGATLDDAAGEAFDKFGKMLGLGFPGGARVDQWAQKGDPTAFELPRSMIRENNCLMSFSGLKASAQRLVESLGPEKIQAQRADLCASFQSAVVDVLVAKMNRAIEVTGYQHAILTGGVSANSGLRERAQSWAQKKGVQLLIPPLRYCTDNAAMIGYAGILRLKNGEHHGLDLAPSPNSWAADFTEASNV